MTLMLLQKNLLFFIVFWTFLGITMSFPIFSPLFLDPEYEHLLPLSANSYTRPVLLGILFTVYPLGQFISLPIFGTLSDIKGRKNILLLTLVGLTFAYLLTGIGIIEGNIYIIVVSRFMAGIFAGNTAIIRSMACDIWPQDKHKSFGSISAATTLGHVLGPVLGSLLIDSTYCAWFSFSTPFFAASLICLFISIISQIYLEETLKVSNNKLLKVNIFSKSSYDLSCKSFPPILKLALIIWFFIALAIDMFNEFLPAFLSLKWRLKPLEIGILNSILCTAYVIGSIWIIPFISRFLSPVLTIRYGMIFYILSLLFIFFFEKSISLIFIFIINDLAVCAILINFYVYISELGLPASQGKLMGIVMSIRMLGGILIGFLGGLIIIISPNLIILFCITIGTSLLFFLFKKIS